MLSLGRFQIALRKHWLAFTAFFLYLGLGLVALGWHLYSVETNVGDTGLSALYLYFLAQPWIDWVPQSVVYGEIWGYFVYPVAMLMVGFNASILYLVFGGLKISRTQTGES